MRIGFDAKRLFVNSTGLGNYSRTLARQLQIHYPEHQYFLYTPRTTLNHRTLPFINNNFTIRDAGKQNKLIYRQWGITRSIQADRLDIFHGLSNELPSGIQNTGTKAIVTIHDLLYLYFRKDFPWIDRKIYDYKFKKACLQAHKIIAISNATKNDILNQFKVDESKIEVVYQSIDPRFLIEPDLEEINKVNLEYLIPKEYLIYVGSIIHRKNLKIILDTYHQHKIKIPLVIVGEGRDYEKMILRLIHDYQLDDLVIRIKRPTLSALNILYRGAMASIYPSLMEGFGLPVLESIAAGTPSITTNLSSLPEAGGQAALYFDGKNSAQLNQMIYKAIEWKNDLDFETKRQKHLLQFDPHHVANQLMEIYQQS